MVDPRHDPGTAKALIDRVVRLRLPRTLALKDRVDAGERLTDTDIAFLKSVLEDAEQSRTFVVQHPELHAIGARLVALYEEIVHKAMENERGA